MNQVKCQLTGQDGNAFAVMGRVQRALKDAGKAELVAEYKAKAMSGDYDNLLAASMAILDQAGIDWD